jgi:hypothetical protein
MSFKLLLLVLFLLLSSTLADIYLHNPRGSNNRNCEKNVDRNNANRLFDSQNNNKGGYPCPRAIYPIETPRMYYYQGSILPITWTMQHSCGGENNYCNVVIQYMCEQDAPGLRDGAPSSNTDPATNTPQPNTVNDTNVGQHETIDYFNKCQTRYRQGGLYIGDRATQNPGQFQTHSPATHTRQNPNGDRYGWECPEERDYYPYWHPTPWRDIVVFTNNMTRCKMYQSESQNVKGKGECYSADGSTYLPYNNYDDCVNVHFGKWVVSGAWNISAPECRSTSEIATHDDNLGYGKNGQPIVYNWVLPSNIESNSCVLRVRYNVSTFDIDFNLDYRSNGVRSPIKQDPVDNYGYAAPLSLAVNTDQFGRTFQDRSYVFSIRKRPGNIPKSSKIYNIGVMGKRGNIVDVYPAIEYHFSPQYLEINSEDYVHFQWTGSDYNNNRSPNDGEGGPRDPVDNGLRADRSNVVQLDYPGLSVPRLAQFNTMFIDPHTGKPDMALINKMAFIGQDIVSTNSNMSCLNKTRLLDAQNAGDTEIEFNSRNCAKLNAAMTPYFDAGLIRFYASGTFHYYSTRNNNFSNRSQKAQITVRGGKFASASKAANSMTLLLLTLTFTIIFIIF